jgi:inhibitor of KinA
MLNPPVRILAMGDRALVVELATSADTAVNLRALALAESLRAAPPPGVTDVVPCMASVTVHYDPLRACELLKTSEPAATLGGLLQAACDAAPAAVSRQTRVVELPVSYGGEHGPDLEEVARHCGLSADEVVRLHAAALYRVCMLGFVPGFGYLGGLDPRLRTPRRATPRKRVPSGSVAIGGGQTGVYPLDTPGGWNIIGRTSRPMVDFANAAAPTLLAPGDTVRFVPVDGAAFAQHMAPRT